jgi:ferritin-like metal-binding protein YciE
MLGKYRPHPGPRKNHDNAYNDCTEQFRIRIKPGWRISGRNRITFMSRNINEQLIHFISDMYSVEQQALAQLVSAPDLAGDPGMAQDFRLHHAETGEQAALMEQRLTAHGASPSAIKDAIMKLGGKGFLLFARVMPETPGRLAAHAYSYEAMEWAGYEMLLRFAEEAGDPQTAAVARTIRDQERAMMERLEKRFDAAEEASHHDTKPEDRPGDLRRHIAEAHALEAQGVQLLTKARKIAGDAELSEICAENLAKSQEHGRLLERRLDQLSGSASTVADAALGMGGLNWGFFFQAQPDTPAKLAAFAYAFEHLKIAGYELLKRTAVRAKDEETVKLCESLLEDERAMVNRLASAFDSAARKTLVEVAA